MSQQKSGVDFLQAISKNENNVQDEEEDNDSIDQQMEENELLLDNDNQVKIYKLFNFQQIHFSKVNLNYLMRKAANKNQMRLQLICPHQTLRPICQL